MLNGLFLWHITEWDQLGIQGWAPLPELQVQSCHVLMDRMKFYWNVLLLYTKLLGLMSNRMQFPQLMALCWEK
jgi:hypothetical protein